MANPFDTIISPEFKALYNQAIDGILSNGALAVPCTINYGSSNRILCTNCIHDPISTRSLNKYNNTGPAPFAEGMICPVCNGEGFRDSASTEVVNLAVLFDSKYWLNWNSKSLNISDGMIQTICNISLLPKIKNAQSIVVDRNVSNYGNYIYSRIGEPELCGLGDNRYIITMWQKS